MPSACWELGGLYLSLLFLIWDKRIVTATSQGLWW